MASVDTQIRNRILRARKRALYTASDFVDLGSRAAIDKALSRMATNGAIRRIGRGLYSPPNEHPVLGTLYPEPEAVAKAMKQRHAIKIQPAGAYAANLLGISEQVPAKIVFLTDGPGKAVRIGNMEIVLRHTTPRNMATAGRLSGLLIQALRHLGKTHVTPEIIAHLRRTIPAPERSNLPRDLRYAPLWMHSIFQDLVAGPE